MEAQCVVCHDRLAAFRCIQCHKPVCDDCAFKDENGAFCSRECSAQYRSYKRAESGAAARGSGSLAKALIILIVLAAIAALVAWQLGYLRVPEAVTDGPEAVEQPEGEEGR